MYEPKLLLTSEMDPVIESIDSPTGIDEKTPPETPVIIGVWSEPEMQ